MGYYAYYLALLLLSYALHYPWLMVGAIAFVVFRPWIPDPWVVLRTMGRIRALERQVTANAANVTARRDLAELYLERLRPRRALALLDEARQRAPNDAELLYLTGVARTRVGDHEGALGPLVEAVEIDPRVRFGEPYLVAAKALAQLGRYAEAEDAFERYVHANSSSIQAHVRLALVRRDRGDRDGARKAIAEALSTWSVVPRYKRRAELRWWLRAHLARALL